MTTEMLIKPTDEATPTTAALERLLADTYVLYIKTHGFHWNVTGPRFAALHAMFETQYLELFAAVDEIAERIRALGQMAPASNRQFSALTSLTESGEPVPADSEMVRQLADDHARVIATANTVLKAAEKADDAPTMDLAIRRMTIHEKTRWMLRASL